MGKVWGTFKKDTQSSVRQDAIVRCWESLGALIRYSPPSLLQVLSRVTQERLGRDPKCTSKSPYGEMKGTLMCPWCSSSMDTPVFFPMWFPLWGKKIGSMRQILVADSTSLLLAACLGITQLPSHFLLLPSLVAPWHLQYAFVWPRQEYHWEITCKPAAHRNTYCLSHLSISYSWDTRDFPAPFKTITT